MRRERERERARRKLIATFFVRFATDTGRMRKIVSLEKRHSSEVDSTFGNITWGEEKCGATRAGITTGVHILRDCLGLFNQRRKNSATRKRAVGFVQSAVRMYERTYAYFMFICIWMCTATCSRRHSEGVIERCTSVGGAPDRHFSIPVGIYHPAHLPRVPSSSHRICVTLRQRAL